MPKTKLKVVVSKNMTHYTFIFKEVITRPQFLNRQRKVYNSFIPTFFKPSNFLHGIYNTFKTVNTFSKKWLKQCARNSGFQKKSFKLCGPKRSLKKANPFQNSPS